MVCFLMENFTAIDIFYYNSVQKCINLKRRVKTGRTEFGITFLIQFFHLGIQVELLGV